MGPEFNALMWNGPVKCEYGIAMVCPFVPGALVVLLGSAVGVASSWPLLLCVGVAFGLLLILERKHRRWEWAALGAGSASLAVGLAWPMSGAVALIAYAVVRGVFRPKDAGIPTVRVPPRGGLTPALVGLAVGLAAAPVALMLGRDSLPADMSVEWPRPPGYLLWALVGLAAVVNATVEELIWRKVLFTRLMESGMRVSFVVAVQAISFGLSHLHGLPGGTLGMIGATVLGVVLGYLRHRTRALVPVIVAHTVIDVTLFGFFALNLIFVTPGFSTVPPWSPGQ